MSDKQIIVPDILRANERINTKVFSRASAGNAYIAREIANCIRSNGDKPTVLGLCSGPAVKGLFRELVRLHEEEKLSFKNVITFNLEEYYPLPKDQLQSTYRFMHENLFDMIDIDKKNVHIPDSSLDQDKIDAHCKEYEELIRSLGIDIMVLGLGRGGNVGFNEPGSSIHTVTRRVHLDRKTRKDAETDFFSIDAVPKEAITMGIGTVLLAKRIFLIAYGEHKGKLAKQTIEEPATPAVGTSLLQNHENTEAILDSAAAYLLTRVAAPWTVIPNSHSLKLEWNDVLTRKAVIWLALKLGKSILRLREEDYINGHLEQLLDARGSVHSINVSVFNWMRDTITGWPGGKPNQDYTAMPPETKKRLGMIKPTGSTTRVLNDYVQNYIPSSSKDKQQTIYPKRVLIFSPHPDDDVISMGGTLIRLVEQGHIVHVAYQTSGNIAVWDDDVKRFANFATRYAAVMGLPTEEVAKIEQQVNDYIDNKAAGQPDSAEIRKIKGLIRETEATAAARYCGVQSQDIHFLNLPFYETGKVKKNPIGQEDVDIVINLLRKVKPHQIYAAGDLTDPHGTHRLCLKAILAALKTVKIDDWFADCQVWLYRGAWQEWEPHEITMAIPMSPTELLQKRFAIFKHQSQKDPPPFPGSDPREFWQRSEARNRETASIYDKLGLTNYEAMEAFVLFDINDVDKQY